MTANKGILYAENELQVNEIYSFALRASEALVKFGNELAQHKRKRRALEDLIESREYEIMSDERGKHADVSATAMKDRVKILVGTDRKIIEHRKQLREILAGIDESENEVTAAKTDVSILTARMIELGGYLQYLTALKLVPAMLTTAQTLPPKEKVV